MVCLIGDRDLLNFKGYTSNFSQDRGAANEKEGNDKKSAGQRKRGCACFKEAEARNIVVELSVVVLACSS
jgi:hypothetical protein